MDNHRDREMQARMDGSILIFRLTEDLIYEIKKQVDNIIEDKIIDHTDPPIFDLRNKILDRMKIEDRDIKVSTKLIPMFSPMVDELRRDFAALIHKKEFPKSDKAQTKVEEMFNKFQKMDMTPKYKIEFSIS